MSLAELVSAGESQSVEFKESLATRAPALEALTSMANTDLAEGLVVFGVRKDGVVVGIEPGDIDRAQQSLVQHLQAKVEPPLTIDIGADSLDEKRVLWVHATRSRVVPFHEYDGRAFIREGTTTRQLSMAEKQLLTKRRNRDSHNGPWLCDKRGCFFVTAGSMVITPDGPKKDYTCLCGGQLWPA